MKKGLLIFFSYCLITTIYGQGSGNTLLFDDRLDNRVEIPDDPTFDHPGNTFTIEAWIYPTAYPSGDVGMIFDKHETVGSREYDLMITSTGQVRVSIYDVSSNPYINYSNSTVPLNQWSHVVHIYSYSTGKQYIYINGILDATFTLGSKVIASTNIKPMIGGYWLIQSSNIMRGRFNGYIDEVRLWHTERTQTEIRTNMCQKLTGSETGLVAYYPLDDKTGLGVNDASVNSNNGTLVNNPTRTLSSAPIGNQSTYIYTAAWTGVSLNLFSSKTSFTVDNITNTPKGFHLYRVDTLPNTLSGIPNLTDSVYYGTFLIVNAATPTYNITYDYTASASTCRDKLFNRDHNADQSWIDFTATQNTVNHTFTKTNINVRGEFIVDLCVPLSVNFLYLNGYVQAHNETLIEWGTALEINNAYFEVEVKDHSGEFKSIGRVNPNPQKKYSFIDHSSSTGDGYYRIKQVDIDGTVSYSSVVVIDKPSEETFVLYPIPFKDQLVFHAENKEYLEITIYSYTGEFIGTYPINTEYPETTINTVSLNAGLYFVYIKGVNGNLHRKIIKQ